MSRRSTPEPLGALPNWATSLVLLLATYRNGPAAAGGQRPAQRRSARQARSTRQPAPRQPWPTPRPTRSAAPALDDRASWLRPTAPPPAVLQTFGSAQASFARLADAVLRGRAVADRAAVYQPHRPNVQTWPPVLVCG